MGGSKLKTISLDGETQKIAEKIPNFSQWVRSKLLEHEEQMNPKEKHSYVCYTCECVFTFVNDKGKTDYCRNKSCKNYMYGIFKVDP